MKTNLQKNKILLVAFNDLGLGGIQNVLMNIVRNLSDEFVFDVVCFGSKKAEFDDEFQSYGGRIFRVERKKISSAIGRKLDYYLRGRWLEAEIKKIIVENGPYVTIHSHKENENGIILKAAKACGVPVRIAHAHTAFDRRYHLFTKLYTDYLQSLTQKYATVKVACSTPAGKKTFGTGKYCLVYNTIDRKFLDDPGVKERHEAPVLLQVGMICENKNQLLSVDVLKMLVKVFPESKLVFIGLPKDAKMEQYLCAVKEKVREAGLEGAVRFLAANADVKTEMQKADYLLLPSHHEGLPLTSIEAQAMGMRCFLSTGVTYEVDCGGCVFTELSAGAEVWAEKIAEQFAKDHGERANFDTSKFAPDRIMNEYRKLYRGEQI